MHAETKEPAFATAFHKGLDYILQAQYPSGGWPQFFPPPTNTYHRRITFNDNAMTRLLVLLREVTEDERYAFVGPDRREKSRAAFGRGVECILKCQIKVDGKITAWCAQHDEVTFEPRPGRKFELVSLSAAESVGIVRLLMSIKSPTPEVVAAVEGAVMWLGEVRIRGVRVEVRDDASSPTGKNKVMVADADAPPLWARFYEVGTNRPIFSDRDAVKAYDIAKIGEERRNGYAWYGTWPQHLIEVEYAAWKKKLAKPDQKLKNGRIVRST